MSEDVKEIVDMDNEKRKSEGRDYAVAMSSPTMQRKALMILDLTMGVDEEDDDGNNASEIEVSQQCDRVVDSEQQRRQPPHPAYPSEDAKTEITDDKKASVTPKQPPYSYPKKDAKSDTCSVDEDVAKLKISSESENRLAVAATSAPVHVPTTPNVSKVDPLISPIGVSEEIPFLSADDTTAENATKSGDDGAVRPGAYSSAPGSSPVSRDVFPSRTTLNTMLSSAAELPTANDDAKSFNGHGSFGGRGSFRVVSDPKVLKKKKSLEVDDSLGLTVESSSNADGPTIIEAFRVVDEEKGDMEEVIRQRIIEESVQANVIVRKLSIRRSGTSKLFWKILAVLVVIAIGVGLAVGLSGSRDGNTAGDVATSSSSEDVTNSGSGTPHVDDESERGSGSSTSTATNNSTVANNKTLAPSDALITKSTLEEVLERGAVRCGVYDDVAGFSLRQPDGNYTGVNFELCRAVAAAVFGNPEQYELVIVNAWNRFHKLALEDVDLISQSVTINMHRDIGERLTRQGFTFSYPFYFSGLQFGGLPEYVRCADKRDPFNGVCRGLKVCVAAGTTQEVIVNDILPGSLPVLFNTPDDSLRLMNDGTCNTIAADGVLLNPTLLKERGLNQSLDFVLGNNTFSRDPLALVTREGDTEWSDIVNSVVKIVFAAEDMDLTSANVALYDFNEAGNIPTELRARIVQVISAIGNYAELYEVHAEHFVPRREPNKLSRNFESGLLYTYPLGDIDQYARSGDNSATMEEIQSRGFLLCGIVENPGFAKLDEETNDYEGIDVEFCRALAAALFVGDTSKVQFIVLASSAEAFQALADDRVDILAGQRVSLANEFFEPTTGLAYSFSIPYFYNPLGSTVLGLATRKEDGDELWSDFVYWVTTSVIYAEEHGITSSNAIEMPALSLFGNQYLQSFRDCISGVGNYGEIYNRTLQSIIPRSGGNLVNTAPYGPQQVAYPII